MHWTSLLSTVRIRDLRADPSIRPLTAEVLASGDTRTEFERDHDRAIFCTPFRRLQDKAQVFPLEPSDAVRTRLTHTMEVASVARGLATAVARDLVQDGRIDDKSARHLPIIAETCGLIHDMGNPPFGHSGEDAIRGWFKKRFDAKDPGLEELQAPEHSVYKEDLFNFEGNAQTLRLLSKLQLLADLDGLNLTAGTFSAVCKYTASSRDKGAGRDEQHERSKLGVFESERRLVEMVREHTGTGPARNPLAFLVEASDDLVYAVVDIEDGIKKGVLTWSTVEEELRSSGLDAAALGVVEESKGKIDAACKRYSLSGQAYDESVAQYFRTQAIAFGVKATRKRFQDVHDEIMVGAYHKELLYDSSAGPLYQALKGIGRRHVYRAPETLRLELLGRRVIESLLDAFWSAERELDQQGNLKTKSFEGKLYSLLSRNYRTVYEAGLEEKGDGRLPDAYLKALLITDYVCGMTDGFALDLYHQLNHG